MTVVLSIETSQRSGSVALRDRDGTVRSLALPEGRRAGDALMPAIDALVRAADLAPADLEVVGVSIGPGGFTGLRIAISTVKMLALALGVRVVPVASALVAAESSPGDRLGAGPVLVTLASKRGGFWGTRVTRSPEGWTADHRGRLEDAATVDLEGCSAVLGDEHMADPLRARCTARKLPVVVPAFSAEACLALTMRHLSDVVDARSLSPLYPRPPEATRLWNAAR